MTNPIAGNPGGSACRVALLSMPISAVELPSLALTQLRARLADCFGDRVDVEKC